MTLLPGEVWLADLGLASHPDTSLKQLSFAMVHSSSGEELGKLTLRVGNTHSVVLYRGHLGFSAHERFRGHRYASRSCLLLTPLLQKMRFSPIWITCNVTNEASKRSIEKIGAVYVETITVPEKYEFLKYYPPGSREKMRFRWEP